jgi:hypothetical protein
MLLFQVAYFGGEKTLKNAIPDGIPHPKNHGNTQLSGAYFRGKPHGNVRGFSSVKKPRKYGTFRGKIFGRHLGAR